MRIEKWYLDSVTPDGAGIIAYAARAYLGPFSAAFSEGLGVARRKPIGPWAEPCPEGVAPPPLLTRSAVGQTGRRLALRGDGLSGLNPIPSLVLA